jgi:prepilin peptidase CpaA
MDLITNLQAGVAENWHIWFLSTAMVVAAIIDGVKLKVPNWLTFPLILSGWVFSAVSYSMNGDPWLHGLGWSLLGTLVGLLLLLPLYSIGGMGAGDVKLLMGCGAWVHVTATFYAFAVGTIVGGVLAIAMALLSGTWSHHYRQFFSILNEINTIRDPEKLSELAANRKPTMRLLPYGIPLTIGALFYFACMGMLI